ncbi:MAG: hypothetical protein LBS52_04390 [Dysgonamonadaceae bacterium]|jgi:hypothetical protein|nr:hypothetical protein [Dysgonamonadaceae bacterium]
MKNALKTAYFRRVAHAVFEPENTDFFYKNNSGVTTAVTLLLQIRVKYSAE